jgi:hypothetical protein
MAYKARFVHGSRTFDLDGEGEYDLFQDFVFPAADEALNATAAPAGSMTGGGVISKTAQDRWWAWSVRIQGSSGTQTHYAAQRLSAWLNGALADKSSKLYFEYTPNYVVPAPIWGQHGQPYRFEVKAAIVDIDGSYYHYTIPDSVLIVPISLYVGPYALGARQRLAQAMGAVFDDNRGTADGLSRGLVVNGALTNRITNPSFETNTTGWTAADCTIEQTTEQAWVGSYGLRQTVSTTNTTAYCYATGNTGTPLAQQNYVASARVYVPEQMIGKVVKLRMSESGGASASEVTAEHVLTPTVSGWNYMYISGTIKKADRTALSVQLIITGAATTPAGSWVIWDAVQLVGPDIYNIYPYIDGDQIGCAWSGTAHGSTSTSTAGYARIPVTSSDTFNMRQGSVCAVMKMPYASTDVPSGANNRVFYTNTGFRLMYYQTNGKFILHDGSISSAGVAASWAAGDIIVVHATWGPEGMKTYFNATASANAAYVNPGAAAYCYIGSNASSPPTERILATFLDFSVWNVPLTAAQITADYALISPHIRGGDGKGQRLSSIPYLWTKDGDNVVDNCTDATRNHYAIAAGIQGSENAETEITGTLSNTYNVLTLSNYATRSYVNPAAAASLLFSDLSGTATGATDCGGAVYVKSLDTSSAVLSNTPAGFPNDPGIGYYVLARIKDAGSDYIRIRAKYDAGAVYYYGDYSRPYATDTNYHIYKTPKLITSTDDSTGIAIDLFGYRAGAAANLSIDYIAVFPEPTLTVRNTIASNSLSLVGKKAVFATTIGEAIEFSPNRYNLLQSILGGESETSVITHTITYNIYYTPRYLIL